MEFLSKILFCFCENRHKFDKFSVFETTLMPIDCFNLDIYTFCLGSSWIQYVTKTKQVCTKQVKEVIMLLLQLRTFLSLNVNVLLIKCLTNHL